MSQYVHILLDDSTYLAVKSKVKNLSKTGNELFKNYVELEDMPDIEEVEILKEMEELKVKIKAYTERISILTVHLTKVRQDKEEKIKQHDRDAVAKLDALRLNNPMRNILGGAQ